MMKTIFSHFTKNSKGATEVFVVVLLVIAAVALVGGLNSAGKIPDYLSPNPGITAALQDKPVTSNKSLQLQEPEVVTLTPSPQIPNQPTCYTNNLDHPNNLYFHNPFSETSSSGGIDPLGNGYVPANNSCTCFPGDSELHCKNGIITGCTDGSQDITADGKADKCENFAKVYQACQNVPDGEYCIGKPVIYLYPTKDTLVNVKLDIPGTVTVSIPEYPIQTGWNNVLAHPNGTLDYQGKQYSELYYESAVSKEVTPTTGILVPTRTVQQELTTITTKLGFLPNEQQEFLHYWLPKLNNLHAPYIFVSLLTQQQKDTIDKVTISPRPDTMIAYLFTFKPVSSPFPFTPWILPTTPPKRTGFTAVEWGGTINN